MMTLQDKTDVLRDALMSIGRITARSFRDAIGASEEEKYDCRKTAFDEVAKVVASVVRRDLIGGDLPAGTCFTPAAERKFAEEQKKKDEAKLAKKRGLVGNCANNRHLMSWNYSDELDIVCRAAGNAEGNEWDFFLEELGRVRAHGTVYGGRWLATRLAKAMRNGMTSFRKKYRKSRSNRAARKSVELAAAAKEEK